MSLHFESEEELRQSVSPDCLALNAEKLGARLPPPTINLHGYSALGKPRTTSGVIASKESEADFQKWLVKALKDNGWRVHAERPARTKDGWVTPVQGDAGYFDVTAIRPPRLLWIECKSDHGHASPEQVKWMLLANKVEGEIEVMCVSPKDREEILEAIK